MSKVRRVNFYADEFLSAVSGELDQAEFCIYWLICCRIYSTGRAIPDDAAALARRVRDMHPRTAKAALERLVASGRVERADGSLMVSRCEKELDAASNRIRTAAENGARGGRKKLKPGSKTLKEASENLKDASKNLNGASATTNDQEKHNENSGRSEATGFPPAKLTNNYQPSTINQESKDSFAEDAAGLLEGFSDLCVEIFGSAPNACMTLAPREMTVAKELLLAGLTVADVLSRARRPLERKLDRGEGPPGSLAYVRQAVLDERAAERDAKSRLKDVEEQIEALWNTPEGIRHQVACEMTSGLNRPVFREALTDAQRAVYDRLKAEQRELEVRLGKALPRSA